ncbi:hypothetical protein Tco_0190755 [Tanacetum coccineum]
MLFDRNLMTSSLFPTSSLHLCGVWTPSDGPYCQIIPSHPMHTNVVNALREPSVGRPIISEWNPCSIEVDDSPHDSQLFHNNIFVVKTVGDLMRLTNIKQVVEEEQTQPEYLQVLLQSLLKDLQILNEIQPLKQEIPNQIQKDQEEKSISELLAERRLKS